MSKIEEQELKGLQDGIKTINNLQINQKVWVALNFVDNGMEVKGTVIGFTKKRIKCEIDGLVANYDPKNVHIREGK